MTIGQNIKIRRNQLNLYQSELAERVGVTQSQICKIETDKSKPSLDLMLKIAEVLKCDITDLTKTNITVH